MKTLIRGGGVAGLTLAWELATHGTDVTVVEIREDLTRSASWHAGGMLAPWCERESAEEPVLSLGRQAIDWWDRAVPGQVRRNGTLVLAPPRDTSELARFARRTSGHQRADAGTIAALEPDLGGRFQEGLYFPGEAHLEPRRALTALHAALTNSGVRFEFGRDADRLDRPADFTVDCIGLAEKHPELRGIRGEMLVLRTTEISLSRPIRLLHPRTPIYIVPWADHHFMVGATMIESQAPGPITARSAMELLNAAYALHPAFGEAQIVESGVGLRPAFPDNLPRVEQAGNRLSINGFYRHGFLLAPAMAREAAARILGENGRVQA